MKFVRPLRALRRGDLPEVGEKNALLGEVMGILGEGPVGVPDGFAVTAEAYREHVRVAGLDEPIRQALFGAHAGDVHDLVDRSDRVRDLVLRAPLPAAVAEEIDASYRTLSRAEGELARAVAVRASATTAERPDLTFAGQYESFLNVRGGAELEEAVRHVFASLFTPRAIAERILRGIEHRDVAMAIGVQGMVRSDLASAGVIYTVDPDGGDRSRLVVTSSWGLGESVVEERVVPDRIYLDRAALVTGQAPLLGKKVGSKETKVVYDWHGHRQIRTVPVPRADREALSCSYVDAIELARAALAIEDHFAVLLGERTPMELEWAKDGITGARYVVQVRAEAANARRLARSFRLQELLDAAQ